MAMNTFRKHHRRVQHIARSPEGAMASSPEPWLRVSNHHNSSAPKVRRASTSRRLCFCRLPSSIPLHPFCSNRHRIRPQTTLFPALSRKFCSERQIQQHKHLKYSLVRSHLSINPHLGVKVAKRSSSSQNLTAQRTRSCDERSTPQRMIFARLQSQKKRPSEEGRFWKI